MVNPNNGQEEPPLPHIALSQNQLDRWPPWNIASMKESSYFALEITFGVVLFLTETKLFEFHIVLYCLSLRLCFLNVFTAEKAIKSLATSGFPKSRWVIHDSLEEGSIFHLLK